MKITKVEYSKTFNLGNYQSAKIGFEAEIEPFEDATNLSNAHLHLARLKELVEIEGAKLSKATR